MPFLHSSPDIELYNKRGGRTDDNAIEMVNFKFNDTATPDACGCKHEERILVAARDPNNLSHLKEVLERASPETTDVLVMTVKKAQTLTDGTGEGIDQNERILLTNIVALAEKYGVNVKPILVPAYDPTYAIAKAAYDLGVKEIVLGKSPKVAPEVQLEQLAMAWGFVSSADPRNMVARVVWPGHEMKYELS